MADQRPQDRPPIPPDMYRALVDTRDASPYTIYDSMVVGQGAQGYDTGWCNTWQDLANAEKLVLFSGRKSNVGEAWTNQLGERRDWAMDIVMMQCEMLCVYPAQSDKLSNPLDAQFMPNYWMTTALSGMSLRIGVADQADTILNVPLQHVPAGHGNTGAFYDSSASPSTIVGTNGTPTRNNGFLFPSVLKLAAKSKIDVEVRISNPIKTFLSNPNLPSPGLVEVNTAGGTIATPCWFVFRISFHGVRYLQLRGARSSS